MKVFLYIIMCVLLFACSGGKQNSVFIATDGGDTLQLRYAKNICIVKHEGYSTVTLADPWKEGETLANYLLSDNPDAVDAKEKEGYTVVKTPIKKALVSTSVHCALYDSLKSADVIAGVCDLNFITQEFVRQGVEKGRIADCGSSMQPNVERVISLSPDVMMLSPYQGSDGYGKVAQLGIPVIELADYMETSPLGRAEWMLFFGMLVGKEEEASARFEIVEKNYNDYKLMAVECTGQKSVMIDKMVQATWYVPGGESTIGQMLRDANCKYAYADTKQSGSIEQSFEQILQNFADADVWLLRYNDGGDSQFNLASLAKENEKYKVFKAFRQGNVYGCETTKVPFFEETPFHPDYLLHDFIIILHPEAEFAKGQSPRYFSEIHSI